VDVRPERRDRTSDSAQECLADTRATGGGIEPPSALST